MESTSHDSNMGYTQARYDEDIFSFTSQLPPLDLSNSTYVPLDWEHVFSSVNGQDQFANELREETAACININVQEKTTPARSTLMLSKETIQQYFYMPISDAAKEMNVGMTALKKRCRELGIDRWPYRKLASIQTLVKNIRELGKDEEEAGPLERERKLMEEVPDSQLDNYTKRLRQACFKAIYKKKKTMSTN